MMESDLQRPQRPVPHYRSPVLLEQSSEGLSLPQALFVPVPVPFRDPILNPASDAVPLPPPLRNAGPRCHGRQREIFVLEPE